MLVFGSWDLKFAVCVVGLNNHHQNDKLLMAVLVHGREKWCCVIVVVLS